VLDPRVAGEHRRAAAGDDRAAGVLHRLVEMQHDPARRMRDDRPGGGVAAEEAGMRQRRGREGRGHEWRKQDCERAHAAHGRW
jgi:hypothetical protein